MRKIYTKQDKTNQKFTTPEVVDYGMILFTDLIAQHEELLSYMVMPRYGQNLEAFFEKQNCSISNASILEIARGTLSMLEGVHAAGYSYNDLKLDNIMVGFNNRLSKEYTPENVFAGASLHLVDFGFATSFVDKKTGLHISQEEVETFRGNMIFGSLNQLNFLKTSRRDDLISLLYMTIYMLNQGKLTGIDLDTHMVNTEAFKLARKAKQNHTLDDLCCDNAQIMKKFANEVLNLKFKEQPDYKKLDKILQEAFSEATDPCGTNSSSVGISDDEPMDEDYKNSI